MWTLLLVKTLLCNVDCPQIGDSTVDSTMHSTGGQDCTLWALLHNVDFPQCPNVQCLSASPTALVLHVSVLTVESIVESTIHMGPDPRWGSTVEFQWGEFQYGSPLWGSSVGLQC